MSQDIKNRVVFLKSEIIRHKELYYSGKEEISDAEFDALEDELRRLDPDNQVLNVVGTATASSDKVSHATPMLSLSKFYEEDLLEKWMAGRTVVATPKLDGVSLSIVYGADGRLNMAKTRGDGERGENVTAKARFIEGVPHGVPMPAGAVEVEVRGEVVIDDESFGRLSARMAEMGLDRPSAKRNIVAGSFSRKGGDDLCSFLKFYACDVIVRGEGGADLSRATFKTETLKLQASHAMGLNAPLSMPCPDAATAREFLAELKHFIEKGIDGVAIDGAVFALDDLAAWEELGATSHHPRYKAAFKWAGETAVTTLREISWETSRLGIVTPVGVVEPVELSGARIERVTLHNAAMVRGRGLAAGARIEIIRSGEVIPKFLKVVEQGDGEVALPSACPSCGSPLTDDEVRLKCSASPLACPAQSAGKVNHYTKTMEIDDLSDKRIEMLLDGGFVNSAADLYRLDQETMAKVFGAKMGKKIAGNIEKSKKPPLWQFITSIGIEGVGEVMARRAASHFGSLGKLRGASMEDLLKIDGFAGKTAEAFLTGLKAASSMIDALVAAGVTPEDAAGRAGGVLTGKSIVITGELSRPRKEIEEKIIAAGGSVSGGVSKKTFAVVTNDAGSGSSKMKKAEELGVQVWSEEKLIEIIG